MNDSKIEEELVEGKVDEDRRMVETTLQSKEKKKVKLVGKISQKTFQKPAKKHNLPKTGKWTPKEKYLYKCFVLCMQSKWEEKRTNKKRLNYFQEMSSFIQTRTPQQCKSHDQKVRFQYINYEDFITKEEPAIKIEKVEYSSPDTSPFMEILGQEKEEPMEIQSDQLTLVQKYPNVNFLDVVYWLDYRIVWDVMPNNKAFEEEQVIQNSYQTFN